jgi:lipopolysaccharide/colanic/teichoic acid biosynthesis glycosyltransferase
MQYRVRVTDGLKRSVDVVASLLGLFILSPLLFSIGIAIKLDTPGPVFYRGKRAGRYEKPFRIFKFRTMVEDAEKVGGPSTAYNDVRLTQTGKFLRRYKLDELPQLLNILVGQMSFVGPRPQVEEYTKRYNTEEKIILSIRPGLTDYASLRFINLDKILGDDRVDERYAREIEPEKNRLRLKYVRERSTWVDFRILAETCLKLTKLRSLWNTKD